VVEHTYVVDFASIVRIRQRTYNTAEAGKNHFPNVLSDLAVDRFHDHAFSRGRDKAEEVFQSGEIGDLHVRSKNLRLCGRFVQNRKSFLKGVLLYLFMALTGNPTSVFYSV